LTVVARAPQNAPVSPIEAGLARLRMPSPEDVWEEGWPEPQFARDLVAAVLSPSPTASAFSASSSSPSRASWCWSGAGMKIQISYWRR
jgi:hypothetical protein